MFHSTGFRRLIRILQQARRIHHEHENIAPPLTREEAGPTRRSFVTGMAAAGAAGIAAGTFPLATRALAQMGGDEPRIAIIGGGLAGLSAAYRLKKQGVSSTIYEASTRLGGRIQSYPDALDNKLVIDMGAELINSDHEDMLAFCKLFEIPLFNRLEDGRNQGYDMECFFFDGKRISEQEVAAMLAPLAAQIAADADALDTQYKLYAPVLDRLSVADYLDLYKDRIPAPYIRTLIENSVRSEFGVEPSEASAILLIFNLPTVKGRRVEILGMSDEAYSVVGGTSEIVKALGGVLESQVQYRKELKSLRQKGMTYKIAFSDGTSAEYDYVIIAIPFTTLRDVTIQAPLPGLLRNFIQEANLGKNAKLLAGFKNRPWRSTRSFSVGAWTDQGHSQIWDAGQRQTDRIEGALTFYLGGDQVDKAGADYSNVAGQAFVDSMEAFVPGAKDSASGKFMMTTWHLSRLTKGAYSTFKPGQLTQYASCFWTEGRSFADQQDVSAGNIVFAGEHLSDSYFGFMNGAAQTGRLAADFVIRRFSQGR